MKEQMRIDLRQHDPEEAARGRRNAELVFRLNHTMPMTEEYTDILHELFGENLGERSIVLAPLQGVCFHRIQIGRHVFINSNLLAMARGGIVIEDEVQIASNVQLLTNNHDPYERSVLLCSPIHIQKGAWIGAGVTILPGVTIGQHAVVGAASVVTRDVADGEVVVGSPARAVKRLDLSRFVEGAAK